jgi:hypothetical protein
MIKVDSHDSSSPASIIFAAANGGSVLADAAPEKAHSNTVDIRTTTE